jgi:hypothetical protein
LQHASSPGWPVRSALLAAIVAAVAAASVSSAAAAVKRFEPVRQRQHTLTYRPRGLEPASIERARIRLHADGRWIGRRVRVGRVRRSVRANSGLRLRKSSSARGGMLLVATRPNPRPPRAAPAASPAPPSSGGCASAPFSASNEPGACWRPYASASPFNTPVGAAPQLSPDSAPIVARTTGFGPPQSILAGAADKAGDFGHPIYFSAPTDPVYTVHCTMDWGTCAIEGMQVRIPAPARPARGDDAHMAVIDQQGGWEYDFWQVQRKPTGGGEIDVGWGGRTRISTADADGLGSPATAAGFGLAAGVIRPAELAAGTIDHALFMTVRCTNGTAVWPAGKETGRQCSDLGLPNQGAPAMGQHFYLAMSDAEIASSSASAWQKTILRAIARYGMFVGDTGGSSWGIQIESGSSYTSFGHEDPWVPIAKQIGAPSWRSPAGDSYYMLDFSRAADWGARLRVAAR